jgi:hypothetical protein
VDSNLIGGIRQALQDIVSPEIRFLNGRLDAFDARITALEKIIDSRFSEINTKLDALLRQQQLELRITKLEQKVV